MYTEAEYKEFADRMEEKFPLMFKQNYGGFAVGPGWWPIIESLSENIQNYIDFKNRQKNSEGCVQVVVSQVKEKFGGLRFYYDGGDDHIDGMVRMAEAWAEHSCEECGAPGKRRNGSWLRTVCDFHVVERQTDED